MLHTNKETEEIFLAGNGCQWNVIKTGILKSLKVNKLERLNFRNCKLGVKGAYDVAKILKAMKCLQSLSISITLYISDNDIGEKGLMEIAKSLMDKQMLSMLGTLDN